MEARLHEYGQTSPRAGLSFSKLASSPRKRPAASPAAMPFTQVDVSPHQECCVSTSNKPTGTLLPTTQAEASIGDESPMDGLGHHGSGVDPLGDHDILDDWLDCDDDVLDLWMSLTNSSTDMGPRTPVCPPSPTAVDCIDSACSIPTKQEQDMDYKSAIKLDANTSIGCLTGSSGDDDDDDDDDDRKFPIKTTDAFADIGVLRAQFEDWMHKEVQRRRQRGYEKTYRKRKQGSLQATRQEWVKKEIEFRECLQERCRALPWISSGENATLQRYLRSLLKVRALQRDRLLMKTQFFWQKLFALRNYTITEEEMAAGEIPEDDPELEEVPEEILRTKEQWAAIDHKILGACIIKPFQPLRFEFEW